MPIKGQQERHFPASDKLDFENYLVALNEIIVAQFQFTLRDGANCGTKGYPDNWTRIQLNQPQAQVKKIEIGYDSGDQCLAGLKLYSKDGAVVLQTGFDWVAYGRYETHTVHLEVGEPIFG